MTLAQMKLPGTRTVLSCMLLTTLSLFLIDTANAQRVSSHLQAFYTFDEGHGDTVRDRSGVGRPLDLKITRTNTADWKDGVLVVRTPTSLISATPATKIIDSIKRSGEITIEAWIKPASDSQAGPARLISLSSDTSQRNVTLGQDKDLWDVRLRSTKTDRNGLPSTASPRKSLLTTLTHIVFTRDRKGTARIYLDAKKVASGEVAGDFGNWDVKHRLTLANEVTGDRPWLGELHLVAIYDSALAEKDVQQNFAAGSKPSPPKPQSLAAVSASLFDHDVAPLFAKHCLECHDSAIKKGELDLSRKTTALAGGESGQVIVPGNAADSLLYQSVSSNEMPKDREPLSNEEKVALKKWIDSGAVYSVDRIDPVIYMHGGGSGDVWIQRLTVTEYITTVRSAVGVDIAKEAHEFLPPDLRADGFRNTAYNLSVDLKHVEAYARLAEITVQRMDVMKFAARFSKSSKLSTDDTMRDHVAAMGKWLFRGPLNEREINAYSGIATTVASAGGDFNQAMTYMIEAMLQSPRFIYRIERQYDARGSHAVDGYDLASRLSYILWGAPPDEDLLKAADRGDLQDAAKLKAQVKRMLNAPLAKDRSAEFVSEWLNLARLQNMRPDAKRFPNWDAKLADDMRDETLAYFDDVVWNQNRPLSDLLDAQFTYATPELARHYGLKPMGTGLLRYDVSSVPDRGGLLTQGSVLTVGGDGASMVSRGLFVLDDLLRGTINAPPPCVNTTPPPTKAGLTQRGIAEQRIADVKCGVCHIRFEPLAFGLEKFDGVGASHEQDQFGNKLRDDGEVLFPGDAKPVKYQSSAELMKVLSDSDRVRESLTWKVTQFALGRPLTAADAPMLADIHKSAQSAGGTYPSLMTAIVLSDLVQKSGRRK
ncbi:Planctomycete cytochrome C [Novipirellula galeiformis]|uniref:Planctomycete cytochrome C n=2 Tax=Novipirellula galeiformis TaxID=2528004 RepID=A0A5C6CPS0_9BACT|nr:Planctomycete cytochrome C [Novipirellula galeiformis]